MWEKTLVYIILYLNVSVLNVVPPSREVNSFMRGKNPFFFLFLCFLHKCLPKKGTHHLSEFTDSASVVLLFKD